MKSKLQKERLEKALQEHLGPRNTKIQMILNSIEGEKGEDDFDQLAIEDKALGYIPETVILDAQKKVYEHKDNVRLKAQQVKDAEAVLAEKQSDLNYAQRQLVETIEFLELWNREAHEDWFAEIGVPRPSGLRVCLPGQAENEGL